MFEIFQYSFMIRAFEAGLIVAVIAPAIGAFLVFRRYSYMADTLGHVSLLGVVLGVLTGLPPLVGALVVSVLFSFGIDTLRQNKNLFGESVLSLFLSGSLALALVIASFLKGFARDFNSFLFGSITTVTPEDIWVIGILGTLIVASIALLYKKFFLITLDEELAAAEGLNVRLYNLVMIFLSALTVALALRIVGVLLIGALMVVPVMTATQLGKSFLKTIFWAIGVSLLSTILGLVFSYYLNTPSGAMIVLFTIVFFLFSLAFSGKRG
jgi:zinc transport system permease protein